MKKFISHIIIFILLALILNVIFKLILNKIYFNEYNQVNLKSEIYLLADSHGKALGSIKTEGVYNFSANSDSYYDMKNKLKFLIKNSEVKTVIITADDHTLSPYRDNSNNLDRSNFFTSQEDYANFFEFIKKKYLFQNLVILDARYGVLIKEYLISFLKPSAKNENNSWDSLPDSKREKKSLLRFEQQFKEDKTSILLKKELLEIIELCEINGIDLIGIKFPLSKEYNFIMDNKSYGADSLMKLNNIKVYDFKEIFSEKVEYFNDQDHLNELGAKKFIYILLNSII